MSLASEFRAFILRGNVVDLAVGVVIGAAFGGVVTALTKDIVNPLIGLPGKVDVGGLSFKVYNSTFLIGDFLNTLISFIIMAFVIFVFVVKPVNWLMSHKKTEPAAAENTRECPYCISKIPIAASRCAFCTQEIAPAAVA